MALGVGSHHYQMFEFACPRPSTRKSLPQNTDLSNRSIPVGHLALAGNLPDLSQ